MPGGEWGAPVLTYNAVPRVVPLGPLTEYRVGVADSLGILFINGFPYGRADHIVWSDVFTLECTDPRPRLAATLAADGTLTLRNLGKNPLEAEVIPAVFRAETTQTWEVEGDAVTADTPFTWPLPWLRGLPEDTSISFTYTYSGENFFFTPFVQVMNGEAPGDTLFVAPR